MATYSFPALGFDPAPGDPDAIEAVARECKRCAADLSADADQLNRLTAHLDWQGAAADAFARQPELLHDDLVRASDAYRETGFALDRYAKALRQARVEARRLEVDAAEAKSRAERHGRDTEQASRAIECATDAVDTTDLVCQRGTSRRLQGYAEDDYQSALTRARAIQLRHELAGARAASCIRTVSDAPYHEPGLLSRMAGGVAEWVSIHAETLRAISNALKVVSTIAGALSLIPVLSPIFAPIAGITAVGALAIDGALVATGHGDWRALALDAALMAVPVAGRMTSRAITTRRLAGIAQAPAQDIASVLRGLRDGRYSGVKVVGSREELEDLFETLSRGGHLVTRPAYPGHLVRLHDGTEVGFRPLSRSGGPTIDVKLQSNRMMKVHVHPWPPN